MSDPAADAPLRAGSEAEARDTTEVRGPSRVFTSAVVSVERVRTVIEDDHDAIARTLADRIVALIKERAAQGRHLVLGLATGSTPIGVYRELIRLHRDEGVSFANVISFNLDEYYPMTADSIHSYHRYMWENLFDHIDIDPSNVHIPAGSAPRDQVSEICSRYEASIADAGGIDFQILGIGQTGHIGFNEPGSRVDSRTRVVTLDAVTRRNAAADFFGEDNVPREALTMGVATILAAREIALIAGGEHKAAIVRRAVEGEVDPQVAATFLQRHPNTLFYLDSAAAAALTRVATPWLLEDVQWTPELTVRAVTWLSRQTGSGILKLTLRDYAEHHLSSLVAQHGSPGEVNGFVFNVLGARIRGRSKLPHGRRIIVFSPHPDDDVISMGGILRKLVLNDNEITVAYMTSGNIAVFDHDVRRYVDFLDRLGREGRLPLAETARLCSTVRDFLAHKKPGEVDIQEIQDIKRVIRESEAVSGIEVMGLGAQNARFLNLPFYRTGQVRKDPIGPEDVAIVGDLLLELRPDLVFVAGDLSDPHGTHRMCKEAIDSALAKVASEERVADTPDREPEATSESLTRPEIWLYRGAWQEWPITRATWLVPMSQEELRRKISAWKRATRTLPPSWMLWDWPNTSPWRRMSLSDAVSQHPERNR